jgi:hypothetical protein
VARRRTRRSPEGSGFALLEKESEKAENKQRPWLLTNLLTPPNVPLRRRIHTFQRAKLARRATEQPHSAVSCVQRATHFSAPKLARCATEQPRSAVSCVQRATHFSAPSSPASRSRSPTFGLKRQRLLSMLSFSTFFFFLSCILGFSSALLLPMPMPMPLPAAAVALLANVMLSCGNLEFQIGKEIGDAGGSGTSRVYSAEIINVDAITTAAVMKRSKGHRIYWTWPPSSPATVVAKECAVLKQLEKAGVENVVRCVSTCYDKDEDSTTLLLQPLFVGSNADDVDPDKASFNDMSQAARATATRKLLTTTTEMIANAHIVPTGQSDHDNSNSISISGKDNKNLLPLEIQLLVNSKTGDILLIDFTETAMLQPREDGSYSAADLSIAESFLRAAMAIVPADTQQVARDTIRSTVARIESAKARPLQPQLRTLLMNGIGEESEKVSRAELSKSERWMDGWTEHRKILAPSSGIGGKRNPPVASSGAPSRESRAQRRDLCSRS